MLHAPSRCFSWAPDDTSIDKNILEAHVFLLLNILLILVLLNVCYALHFFRIFLAELSACGSAPEDVGTCFIKHVWILCLPCIVVFCL